ncbi:hypothetical protein JCM19232_915 [Vibrio ishigakensis]|uniref:Uncharacterized protein n=1 Tax=Vibrio ishigakensis TaxID=1481914 RepID=A0A0B8PSN5_9VIBR|nr:hypothetical protein JCM19232_915 [Vibrio ishigakensis]
MGFQWGSDGIWKGVSERSKNKSTLKRNQLVSKYGQASQRVINYDNAYLRWSEQYHSWNAQLSEKLCSFPKK